LLEVMIDMKVGHFC